MKKLTTPYTRDIAYLHPDMQIKMPAFLEEVAIAKIPIIITCTARKMQMQVALFAQGRQPLAEINKLRLVAGLPPINAIEAKKKVTWTLLSRHLVDYDNTKVEDDYSDAFDFVIKKGKIADYNVKTDVNENKIADYQEVGIIAEKYGWVWGGRWKTPDYPHIERRK